MNESARLIGDVQRFGLLSAAAVVDRYRHLVDHALDEREDDDLALGRLDGLELVDPSWLVDRASRLAAGYLRFLDNAVTASASRRPQPAGLERVSLPRALAGAVVETSLWVHNPTEDPVTGVDVVVTAFLSSGGDTIPPENITVTPGRVERLDAGGSREVRVQVDVPTGLTPGRFFGLAHVSVDPDHPVAIDVRVTE